MATGTHESIYLYEQKECILASIPPRGQAPSGCCPVQTTYYTAGAVPASSYLSERVSQCDILVSVQSQLAANCSNPDAGIDSIPEDRPNTYQKPVPVRRAGQLRSHPRVSRIDHVARTNRSCTASERTSRLRDLGSELVYFRAPPPPPPPCPLPFTGNPGVPVAPQTPCNLGFQRVDFRIPRR
jgi:hypothetical protein